MPTMSRVPRPVSPQTAAINDLYFNEAANAMRKRVLAGGLIRVALYRDGQNQPTSVWFVSPDGQVRREVTV